jgi:hypothetical protein
MITGKIKPVATFDPEQFRYRITPVNPAKFGIGNALRAIKATHVSWREIAQFCGLTDQATAFRIAYIDKTFEAKRALAEFLTIEGEVAYLYDKDHKPAAASKIHVPVTINVNQGTLTITERVPSKLGARVSINDPIVRRLTMTVTPINGYVLGMSDINLCVPGQSFTVTGHAKTLNEVLRKINFVGWDLGDAKLEIVVDDMGETTSSVVTATIPAKVVAGKKVSIPEIVLPDNVTAKAGEETKIAAVKVTDEDGKIMELRVTPFGCEVFGFKNYLHVIGENEVRVVTGRPEVISEDIANLTVRIPEGANRAVLGFQIICGKTILNKYLTISLTDGDSSSQDPEPAVVEPTADNSTADNATLTE